MKVFIPDIHKTLTKNLCVFFRKLGWQVIVPSNKYYVVQYPKPPVQRWVWNTSWAADCQEFGPDVLFLSKQEVIDAKPDLLFITNYESQFEILEELAPKLPNAKIAFYSGNDYWDGWFDHSKYQNYISADETGRLISEKYRLQNAASWIPFIYPEESNSYGYQKHLLENTSRKIGCYINNYEKNFPRSYGFYKQLKEITPKSFEFIENSEKPYTEVLNSFKGSSLTIHIKELEGLGLATLESLAFGRPLILHRGLAANKSLTKWSRHLQTCFFIENGRDYIEFLDSLAYNDGLLIELQKSAYFGVRASVNEDEQLNVLKNFLEKIQ